MKITLLPLVLLYSFVGVSDAQSVDDLVGKWRHTQRLLSAARSVSKSKSEVEFLKEQRKSIDRLYDDFKHLSKDLKSIRKQGDEESVEQFLQRATAIKTELLEQILLPDQAKLVKQKTFAITVRSHDGNVIKAIVDEYAEELGLSDADVERLSELEKEVAKKISDARERFLEEMQGIKESMKNDLTRILEKEQTELIDQLNQPIAKSNKKDAKQKEIEEAP